MFDKARYCLINGEFWPQRKKIQGTNYRSQAFKVKPRLKCLIERFKSRLAAASRERELTIQYKIKLNRKCKLRIISIYIIETRVSCDLTMLRPMSNFINGNKIQLVNSSASLPSAWVK